MLFQSVALCVPPKTLWEQNVAAWTDDRVETLKRLWADGLSGGEIARRLVITRNAVIGKVYRLGLPGRVTTSRRNYESQVRAGKRTRLRPHLPKMAKTATQLAEIAARSGAAAERQTNQAGSDLVVPPDQRKQLLDLERGDCRWPYGTGTKADPYYFCCHKAIPGKSYCDFHNARSLQPIQPRLGRGPQWFDTKRALQQPQIPLKSLEEFDAMETA
jgi:GcrA cell cycle regulator